MLSFLVCVQTQTQQEESGGHRSAIEAAAARNLQAIWARKPDCQSGLQATANHTSTPDTKGSGLQWPKTTIMQDGKAQTPISSIAVTVVGLTKPCLALGSNVRFLYVLKDPLQLSRQNSDGPSSMNTRKSDRNKDCHPQNQDHKSHSRIARPYRPTMAHGLFEQEPVVQACSSRLRRHLPRCTVRCSWDRGWTKPHQTMHNITLIYCAPG